MSKNGGRYFGKLDPFAIQLVLLSTALGALLGALLSALALRYVEKRTLTIAVFVVMALLQPWPPLFQLLGWLSLSAAGPFRARSPQSWG